MNNQNVEPATSKSDIVLVTLAVLCAVAGVIAFSLLTSQTLAVCSALVPKCRMRPNSSTL